MTFFDSKECEWSDQELLLNGVKVAKLRSIKIKKSREMEELYASGDDPISLQRGNKKYDLTLGILKGALDDINRSVKAVGGPTADITDAEFIVVCNYKAKGTRALQSHTVTGVQFGEFEFGMAQNDKFNEVSVPGKGLGLIST